MFVVGNAEPQFDRLDWTTERTKLALARQFGLLEIDRDFALFRLAPGNAINALISRNRQAEETLIEHDGTTQGRTIRFVE